MPVVSRRTLIRLRKLAGMESREILFRVQQRLTEYGEHACYALGMLNRLPGISRLCPGAEPRPRNCELSQWWLGHMRGRDEPLFLLDAVALRAARALYRQLFPERLAQLRQRADRVVRGEFSFLGLEFQVGDPIEWQRDPQSGHVWPRRFYASVPIPFCEGQSKVGAPADAKYVWELNRHEFLVDCAKAFYLTGESLYAQRVCDLISSWIRDNPYLQGVNWAGPLEVAARAISWLWTYQFCRRWDGLDSEMHLRMSQSFYQHGHYLYRHLEVYRSPNNHLVGEATALYMLGCFFTEFDEARAWRDRGWNVLSAEVTRQFYADGGSTEQAISYHHYCLGFFVLALLTRQRRGDSVPALMRKRLEAAFDFSMWMTQPDGTMPRIGDADDARSIRLGPSKIWDFRNLLSLGAAVFARGDWKAVAGPFSEDALWLLGSAGYERYQELDAKTPTTTSRLFPETGYAVMRSGWGSECDQACFDCGPIGLGVSSKDVPVTTHGHADVLSLTISAGGQPLLVDSGFYTFSGSTEWHRYCRDVQGHNTLRVDGVSQAKLEISNAWSCAARPELITHQACKYCEIVEGAHSGFHGLNPPVRHRRAVFWKPRDYWVVFDRLEGEGAHSVDVFFHFAPGCVCALPDDVGVSVQTDRGLHGEVRYVGHDRLSVDVACGGPSPEGGWIATSYGVCQAAPRVRFHGQLDLPVSLTFLVSASRQIDEPIKISHLTVTCPDGDPIEDAIGLQIGRRDDTDVVGFCWNAAGPKQLNEFEFDGRCFFARVGDKATYSTTVTH